MRFYSKNRRTDFVRDSTTKSVELQYMIFEKSNKDENEKKS